MTFWDFAQKKMLSSSARLEQLLNNMGIHIEGYGITQVLDTSQRETLWDDLRKWKGDHSASGRRLRRNEATQVEWMVRLRTSGTRAWFLSIDGQLRRALLSLRRGYYAGFVMTPTAWAHQIADLHWGEIDLSGFSALMWSFPAKTVEERAQELVLRKLLTEHPEAVGLDPEWLRDRVEDLFSRGGLAASLPASISEEEADPDEEAGFKTAIDNILPAAVSAILDQMGKRRLQKSGKR
jgi:hypothetical protein